MDIILATFIRPVFVTRAWHSGVLNCHNNKEERGYEDLGLTAQNLRDQAARTEKTLGNVTLTIAGNVGTRNSGKRKQVVVESYLLEADCSNNLEFETNLHIVERTESGDMQITEEDSVIVETTTIDGKERELLESASSILLSINNTQGD